MPDVAGSSSDGGYGGTGGGFGGGDASFGNGIELGSVGSGPTDIATSINDVAVIGGYSLGLYDSPISFAGAGLIDLATHGPGTTAVGNVGKDISNGLQNSGMMAAGNVGLFESTSVSVADFGAAAGGNDAAYAVNLGGGQIAEYNASGALISIIPDPSFYASGGGANGSEGGG